MHEYHPSIHRIVRVSGSKIPATQCKIASLASPHHYSSYDTIRYDNRLSLPIHPHLSIEPQQLSASLNHSSTTLLELRQITQDQRLVRMILVRERSG